jgi:Transposase
VRGRERRLVTRTRERHTAIRELLAAGHSLAAISRTLGLDRTTVQRSAREPDVARLLVKATSRDSKLDPFKPWICQRQNQGITRRRRAARRTAGPRLDRQRPGRAPLRPPLPRPDGRTGATPGRAQDRQITRWLLSRPSSLDAAAQASLAAIRDRCPHLDGLARHVTGFAEMMTTRTGSRDLDSWLAAVEADDQPELHSFAAGIRKDRAAITAGLTLPYSSGAVEGNVTRIKMIKGECTAGPASPCCASARHLPPHVTRSRNSQQSLLFVLVSGGRVKASANSTRSRVAPSPRPAVVTAGVRPELPSLVLPCTS